MSKQSAGILLYRLNANKIEVFLVHPGGPFFAKKDIGAWSIPKGEFEQEDAIDAAKREFREEIGISIDGEMVALTPQKQKSGKVIYAWALKGDIDVDKIKSNEFELEWPPKSGKKKLFPEIDKAQWFDPKTALEKINLGQVAFIKELMEKLGESVDDNVQSNPSQPNLSSH